MPPSARWSADEAMDTMKQAQLLLNAAAASDAARAAETSVPMEDEVASEALMERTLADLFASDSSVLESFVVGMEVAVEMQGVPGPSATDANLAPETSTTTTTVDNRPLLAAIKENSLCVINGQPMAVHTYLEAAMAEAAAEVGVTVGNRVRECVGRVCVESCHLGC